MAVSCKELRVLGATKACNGILRCTTPTYDPQIPHRQSEEIMFRCEYHPSYPYPLSRVAVHGQTVGILGHWEFGTLRSLFASRLTPRTEDVPSVSTDSVYTLPILWFLVPQSHL